MSKNQLNKDKNLNGKKHVSDQPISAATNIREPTVREKCLVILSYLFEQGPYSYEKLVNELARDSESPMQAKTLQSHIDKTAKMNSNKAQYYKKRLPKVLKQLDIFREFDGDFNQAYHEVVSVLQYETDCLVLLNEEEAENTLSIAVNNDQVTTIAPANAHAKTNDHLALKLQPKTLILGSVILIIVLIAINALVASKNIAGYTVEQHEQLIKAQQAELKHQYKLKLQQQYEARRQDKKIFSLEKHLLEKELADIQNQLVDIPASHSQRIQFLTQIIEELKTLDGDFDDSLLQEAQTALQAGFTDKADALFEQVEKKQQSSIQRAAKSAFQRGLIAQNNIDYQQAFSHYQRAISYDSNNAQYFEQAGLIAGIVAQYDKQLDWTQRSLALYQNQDNPDPLDLARLWNNLGLTWQNKGDYNQAINYFKRALASDLSILNEHHPNVIEKRSNLGMGWYDNGGYNKAIHYFELALASALKTFSEHHQKVAEIRNDLGLTWNHKGDYDKAIHYFEQALASNLKVLGKQHPDVAQKHNNLGLAWRLKGDYDKAVHYYELTLTSNLNVFGEEHPKVAKSRNNLGVAWHYKGDDSKAADYFEQALESNRKTLGEDHPSVSLNRSNLARILFYNGDYDKAINYTEYSLNSSIKTVGKHHPNVARDHNNLGEIWVAKGDYDKAIEYYELALANNLNAFGKYHPNVARNHHNLGIVWFNKGGNLKKASLYFELALEARKKKLGRAHPDTKDTTRWLATTRAPNGLIVSSH